MEINHIRSPQRAKNSLVPLVRHWKNTWRWFCNRIVATTFCPCGQYASFLYLHSQNETTVRCHIESLWKMFFLYRLAWFPTLKLALLTRRTHCQLERSLWLSLPDDISALLEFFPRLNAVHDLNMKNTKIAVVATKRQDLIKLYQAIRYQISYLLPINMCVGNLRSFTAVQALVNSQSWWVV